MADDRHNRARRRETRARILAAADGLFATHGFGVTVGRIADTAGVSVATVRAYFPAKEGLFFAAAPPVDGRLPPAVRHRRRGESAYEAVRRHATRTGAGLVRAVWDRPPGETVYEAITRFRAGGEPPARPDTAHAAARARTYRDSPQLRAYAREQFARQEETLAGILAADTWAAAEDPVPAVAAASLIAPLRAMFDQGQRWLAEGHPPAEVARWRLEVLARAYDAIAPGLADYARRQG